MRGRDLMHTVSVGEFVLVWLDGEDVLLVIEEMEMH